MLYIEQPVGIGYSQGTPNIQDGDDLATQFAGFLQQFLEVFPELKGKRTCLTGERVCWGYPFLVTDTKTGFHPGITQYAGMYVPYIADYIYKNKAPLDLSLQGIWIADRPWRRV